MVLQPVEMSYSRNIFMRFPSSSQLRANVLKQAKAVANEHTETLPVQLAYRTQVLNHL